MGPCLASGRMGPEAVASWKYILGDSHPVACLDLGLDLGFRVAGIAVSVESVRGMGLVRIRLDLDRQPCRLAHRTPVLYSRN